MSSQPAASAPRASAVAECLLAHARLCEQVARACWNEETAQKLLRMALDCTRTAAQIASENDAKPATWH